MARSAALLVFAVAVAGAASGCSGSDDTPETRGATPAASPATTSPRTDGASADPLAGAGTQAVSARRDVTETALLNRVAIGRHEGFDRVVLQFRYVLPGYPVEYVNPPLHEDGSGHRLEIAGRAFVEVRMERASGFDVETGEGELVYRGPRRISGSQAGTSTVREIVRTGDFEAQLTWAIGLSDRVGFRVSTLDRPARLVVDFRNR